ncbi:MAG: VOC family protein [Pseudomonadota bacterium]
MSEINLEHVNITVSDPQKTAQMLCDIFDWKIRWHGAAMNGEGYTYHVGTDTSYVAVYTGNASEQKPLANYDTVGGLNHIAVVVDDIDAMERKIIDVGLHPRSHADYEPGKRFYFVDRDGIEYEIVSYS